MGGGVRVKVGTLQKNGKPRSGSIRPMVLFTR
jgi:hypothetical protein